MKYRSVSKTSRALVTATLLFAAASAASAQDTGLYMSILPPGQSGYLTVAQGVQFLNDGTLPPHVDDQREMYGNLVLSDPGLTDADLIDYFKPAPIADGPNIVQILPPIDGVTITRDEFGVPNIKARTRKALFKGIGYAMAGDRLFAMDLLRHAGRGRASEFIGPDPFALDQDESFYQFAGYSEEDYENQIALLQQESSQGRQALRDIEEFVAGVNHFVIRANVSGGAPIEYTGLDKLPVELFKVTDVLAITVQLEQLFGAGGAGEHRNANLLQKLTQGLGAVDGQKLFDDLRNAEEPEAPVTTELSFPYLVQGPVDPAAVAIPDLGSVTTPAMVNYTGPLPAVPNSLGISFPSRSNEQHPSMSNFLAVSAQNAVGGHPIAVMGPQMAYFVPEIVTEISMETRTFRARGAAVVGTPYVVLGRGRSYAWSATAGGSDNTDVRVEKLCVPGGGTPTLSSNHYMFDGECTPMYERLDTWCTGTTSYCESNPDNVSALVQRTVHGLVFGHATVGGEPVALVKQRASFGREGENAAAFVRINRRTQTAHSFERSISRAPGSFNWLYVNESDIFYFHSGRFPIRAEGVDFELPSWGTGEWEWQGLVPREEHPSELNPAKGYLTSWNNKPARDWHAADANYSFGTVHRVDSLDEGLEAALMGGPLSVGKMVEVMEDAGTRDLRATQILPLALQLIGSEPSIDPELTILQDWVDSGGSRRDRNGNGFYDNGTAVAILDEWFPRMIDATLGPQLAAYYSDIPMGFDDKPGERGSAYQSGYYGYLDKTLRTALGQSLEAPLQLLKCADGTPAGCRTALVDSLSDAITQLETDFSSTDPNDWQADPTEDFIHFTAFGLAEVDPIPWINRPTFQQVVQVTSR